VSRRLSLLCAAAVSAAGLSSAVVVPAAAAPAAFSPASSSPASSSPAAVSDELVVGYVEGASDGDRARARGRADARLAERVVAGAAGRREVERVHLPQGKSRDRAIAELRSDPAVAYAEPNWLLTTGAVATDPYYTSTDAANDLWGMYGDVTVPANDFGSQAGEAWAAGHTGSAGVYVGVIDEGIQFTHPDLDGQVWTNPLDAADGVDNDGNGYVDDVHGWDFANDDNTIYDGGDRGLLDDHGTHVSGTIGAKMDGSGVVGVNWSTTLISGKFLGRRGGTLANAVKAVDYFTDLKTRHGLNIVATNNSWGGGGFSQSLLDAITRGAQADILFVAAAGNSGDDNDTTASYPSNYDTTAGAGYDAVIAVAAIDRTGALASFSQYGATTVDLGAPGVGVWSTTAFNTYSSYNGTSMATPHVTGGAALYASTHPGATAADIKAAILTATVPTDSLAGKTVTGGRLNVSGF
jgi:subtilisin family serine protease